MPEDGALIRNPTLRICGDTAVPVLLTLGFLHVSNSHLVVFLGVPFCGYRVFLNMISFQDFKSHSAGVYKEEQFLDLFCFSVAWLWWTYLLLFLRHWSNSVRLPWSHQIISVVLNPVLVLKSEHVRSCKKKMNVKTLCSVSGNVTILLKSQSHCRSFKFSHKARVRLLPTEVLSGVLEKLECFFARGFIFQSSNFLTCFTQSKSGSHPPELAASGQTRGTLHSWFIQVKEVFLQHLLCAGCCHKC